MEMMKPSRGRPKGTGLNDDAQLRAIASLMTSDPDLRPTTAIRRLGIQDPSIIRRLRDKYQACEADLIAEMASNVAAGGLAPSALLSRTLHANEDPKQAQRAMPLAASEETKKSQPVKVSSPRLAANAELAHGSAKPEPRPTAPKPAAGSTDMPDIMGISLSLIEVSFRAQIAVAKAMFQLTTIQAVLESQISLLNLTSKFSQSTNFTSEPSTRAAH